MTGTRCQIPCHASHSHHLIVVESFLRCMLPRQLPMDLRKMSSMHTSLRPGCVEFAGTRQCIGSEKEPMGQAASLTRAPGNARGAYRKFSETVLVSPLASPEEHQDEKKQKKALRQSLTRSSNTDSASICTINIKYQLDAESVSLRAPGPEKTGGPTTQATT